MNKTFIRLMAFTLSELLVTLSIIGVVSALTVPTLLNKYQAQANVTQLRKIYFDIGQATDLIITDESKTKLTSTSFKADRGKFFKKYFKVAQDCDADLTPCFAESYKTLRNDIIGLPACNGYSITTVAGYALCITAPNTDGNGTSYVLLDINGPDKPNIAGRDLFSFQIYSDGSVDEGLSPTDKQTLTSEQIRTIRSNMEAKCSTNNENAADGCFSKILNANWKMNY